MESCCEKNKTKKKRINTCALLTQMRTKSWRFAILQRSEKPTRGVHSWPTYTPSRKRPSSPPLYRLPSEAREGFHSGTTRSMPEKKQKTPTRMILLLSG